MENNKVVYQESEEMSVGDVVMCPKCLRECYVVVKGVVPGERIHAESFEGINGMKNPEDGQFLRCKCELILCWPPEGVFLKSQRKA